ncbi:MAG TPA: [protein-PII] uridylyltransferase [Acidimicrobiales bacterium]|nr:[protein-PII] uridylyltransferase [Acidimicrobiales bacterium]
MELDRAGLLADEKLTGRAFCRAHSDLVDAWLAKLFQNATGSVAARGLALVAVGGYGRAELCPQSDIDVVLLHDDRHDIGPTADRLWYPVWDAGLTLGHSVRTVRQAVQLAGSDLDTATSALSARHLAGDTALSTEFHERALARWRKGSKRWLTQLDARVRDRHERAGEVAFLLEPDLKDGRGGLRDVHALRWAEAARRILLDVDAAELEGPYQLLLEVRVELQRHTGRASDQLLLQEQDAIASALDYEDADRLMGSIAIAARTIAWTSDDAWRRVESSLRGPLGRIARRDRELQPGIVLRDREVHVDAAVDLWRDPTVAVRAAMLAAQRSTLIDRDSLERLAAASPPLPVPWTDSARTALVALLRCGHDAIPVIEALDQRGVWARVLPEWLAVRSRPQRNAYHRFTVDRHLLETAANAAELADRVSRPDLLVVGALLHDLGKGLTGDHTERGIELARVLGARMGFGPDDVDVLVAMVQYHLLLPDVATRRDLDDPGTIEQVAQASGSLVRLQLLGALTEADSRATGPSAWSEWKASLVAELVERAAHVLRGGAVGDVAADGLTPEQQRLLDEGPPRIDADRDELTLVVRDEPGVFSRVAGVLAMHGVDVVAATIHSDGRGTGLEQFRVDRSLPGAVAWPAIVADLERMLDGALDVDAEVERRARRYERRAVQGAGAPTSEVRFDNEISSSATVVDVYARDGVGVLYRITDVLARHGLDIRSAKVQTMGAQVVDAFYIRAAGGGKVTDSARLSAIRSDVLAALTSS